MSFFVEIDGNKFISRVVEVEEDSEVYLKFMLFNMSEIYMEKVKVQILKDRWKAKECNPFFSALSTDFVLSILKQEAIKYSFGETSEDTRKLETLYKKKDEATKKELSFKFYWLLRKCDPEEFSNFLTNPLIKTVLEQELKIVELKKIVTRKDQEIEQYKNSGAQLIVESMATEKFEEEKFNEKWENFQHTKDENFVLNLTEILSPDQTDKEKPGKLCDMLKIKNIFSKEILEGAVNPPKPVKKSPSKNKFNKKFNRNRRVQNKRPEKLCYADSPERSQELLSSKDKASSSKETETEVGPPEKLPRPNEDQIELPEVAPTTSQKSTQNQEARKTKLFLKPLDL